MSPDHPPVEAFVFDHVNIRTAQLDAMVDWYGRALGLTPGWRPAFPFPGAWLYIGGQALVHLIAVDPAPRAADDDLRLEHFALRGTDMDRFVSRMASMGVATRLGRPPGAGVVQVNIVDPDGNHIHVDFPAPAA